MDTFGLAVAGVSVVLYFLTRKGKGAPFFILTTGIGLGILIGAIWAYMLVDTAFSAFP